MADNIEQGIKEFYDLIEKIDRKNPDKSDVQRAESLVRNYPEICTMGMGIAGSILKAFLDKQNPQKSQQLFFEAEALHIKKSLGYSTSNQIERLLIDQVLFCWAGVNYAQAQVSGMVGGSGLSLTTLEYWQETLTHYQKRYLRAIETLAKIRKLNISIQVNIAANGGKQVNIANNTPPAK